MSDSKRYSTLVNNTILFAISNFGSKIISLIIQPYLSYALASPDVMGVTSLMQSVANLLIPVVSLGVSFAVRMRRLPFVEIGRASCRERV